MGSNIGRLQGTESGNLTMKNLRNTLIILTLFNFITPSYAEPACGSDTSTDPDVARGKDTWLNGHCNSFLPCKLALVHFQACQAVENFLTNLGAKEGVSLTEEQVEVALVKTKQGSVAGAATEKKPMSQNVALIERNRVSEMDSKAEALVQSNCGAFGCDRLLESTVNPVIREVEALNSNPEYLAHMPKFAPIASVETAARFGWKKDGAFWVSSGVNSASNSTVNTSTLKDYLLSVPECQKLHDKLDQDIKANPSKEPFNLSFFEGECVPQVASYAEEVKNWRVLLAANPTPPLQQTDVAEVIAPELSQWNNNIVAEENKRIADIEEKKRVEAERVAEQAAIQQKEQLAAVEHARQSMLNSQYSSICARNETKVVKIISASSYRDYSGYAMENEEKVRLFASLHKQCAGDERSRSPAKNESSRSIVEDLDKELEVHRQNCSRSNSDCSRYYYDLHSGKEADSTRNYMQLYRSEVNKALSDPNYSADLEPASSNGQASSGDANCEAKLKSIDNQVAAALPSCGASASCNLQAAMWGLSQQISTIESNCPSGKYASMLSDARKQLVSVTTTCGQIVSGGRCEPKL